MFLRLVFQSVWEFNPQTIVLVLNCDIPFFNFNFLHLYPISWDGLCVAIHEPILVTLLRAATFFPRPYPFQDLMVLPYFGSSFSLGCYLQLMGVDYFLHLVMVSIEGIWCQSFLKKFNSLLTFNFIGLFERHSKWSLTRNPSIFLYHNRLPISNIPPRVYL